MAMRYESYAAPRAPEWMLVHGPATGNRVLILPALFAEGNLTRALVSDIARRLAAHGIGSAVPDLPGTGESRHALIDVTWDDWRTAAAAAGQALGLPHVVSLRGCALIDDGIVARSRWRLAPVAGADLIRQLERAQRITDTEAGGASTSEGAVDLAGYRLPPALRDAIRAAEPAIPAGPLRTVPFEGPGLAPWRRAEPGGDAALASRLADDIAEWVRACDA